MYQILWDEVILLGSIPNIITTLRIVLSISFLFIWPFSRTFYIVYLLCGITDILDGSIARKFKATSQFGSLLDTLADTVMTFILFFVLVPIITIPSPIFIWIILIAVIRMVSLVIAFFKYHTFVILHSYSNKLTGAALFLFILLYPVLNSFILMSFLCIIASVAAIEELLIHIKSKTLSRNRTSIFK